MRKIHKTVGFFGCGNMGGAILRGICEHQSVPPQSLYVYDTDKRKMNVLKKTYKVQTVDTPEALFAHAAIVVLAVKPQTLAKIALALPQKVRKQTLVVSILAGTPATVIKKRFKTPHVVRVMPNLGAMLGAGISVVAMNRSIAPADFRTVLHLFSTCGDVVQLPERLFDVVTAVSGSGPAYFFYLTELLAAQATRRGIPAAIAKTLAEKTAVAAAEMMAKSSHTPEALRRMVTSPSGTTEAALKRLKKERFESAFNHGIDAAIKRGRVLARGRP